MSQEVQEGVAHASVGFEYDGGDRVRVVFGAFVELGSGGGVSRGVAGVHGTRQGSRGSGGGNHDVQVEGWASCVEGDVGAVEWCGVLVNWLWLGGGGAEELFGEGVEAGDFINEGGDGVL